MSDDKRLKSTEIIYNDRSPTDVLPGNAAPGRKQDSFGENLMKSQTGQPGATGRETQINFGDAVKPSDPSANPGQTAGSTNSGLATLAGLLGIPAQSAQQVLDMLPDGAIAKLAAQFGLSQDIADQIQQTAHSNAPVAPNGFYTPRPTTGWLVVTKGPGRGTSLPLSFGRNEVGRDPDQAVPLVFGDEQISRRSQFVVTFDPRSGKFLCSPGESTRNLCYLSGEPLISPMLLDGATDIEVGETTLRFVPFCDGEFLWTAD